MTQLQVEKLKFNTESAPFGGSFVILTPFWRTATGKYGAGLDVRNSLKSLWLLSRFSPSLRRTTPSRDCHSSLMRPRRLCRGGVISWRRHLPKVEVQKTSETDAASALEAHDLQIVHPGLGQHAVLEEDPVSTLDSFGY